MDDVAQFLRGDDLRQLVHRFERLPPQEAASVGERGDGEGAEIVTEDDSQQVSLGSRVLSLIYMEMRVPESIVLLVFFYFVVCGSFFSR